MSPCQTPPMKTPSDLPPFPALCAFEAVGRLQSFRLAAEELCISQSAVSYHVKTLEDATGARLFERRPRGIEFTPAGQAYWRSVADALRRLRRATAALQPAPGAHAVRLSVLPSFAAGWLLPRLAAFQAARPDIHLALDPRLELADLDGGEVDLAIRYGHGRWPGVKARLLMAEQLAPVASPALLRRGAPIRRPQDVVAHTLLHVSRRDEWEQWAQATGADIAGARTQHLTEYGIVLQAAQDGLGLAMGRRLLVADRLAAGQLVAPLHGWVAPPQLGYWLCRGRRTPGRAVQAVMDWLLSTAGT
jgi:LysR family transcriptional regulator, glycine cleavage system transcriptional activator